MVILIFNKQLFENCITNLPTDELRTSHDTHQNQTRMGLHAEEIPCLQQETGVDAVGNSVPPYLKRKLLMRHEDRSGQISCDSNCMSEEKLAILGVGDSDTSAVSDDGDWTHSDHSDVDVDEAQRQLGVGVGEFPLRVRWLRSKQLLMKRRRATVKCAHRRHDHDGKITQIQVSPHSGRRKDDTETAIVTSGSRDHNSKDDLEDESTTRKRQRLGTLCHGSVPEPIIQRVEEGLGGFPVNTDGACEVIAPPIPIIGHLSDSEASALSVDMGLRRSQRIRKKLSSACGTSPSRRSQHRSVDFWHFSL